MKTIAQPGKEAVRAYLTQRMRERTPLPTRAEIRRRLGWDSATFSGQAGPQPVRPAA
jgi:hypothetical protein